MRDTYELVEFKGLERPEYILRNGKAFNIYKAKKVLEAQQEEIYELRAMVGALRCKALEVITSNSSNTGYEPSQSVFQRDITELYNLHQAMPTQCLAGLRLDGAKGFRDEMLAASTAILHLHIEGVFAVYENRVRDTEDI